MRQGAISPEAGPLPARAQVTVESRVTGSIASGLMILLGVGTADTAAIATSVAEKCANLRIFEDEQGKMNKSLLDVKGEALVVSQFTLYGDARGQVCGSAVPSLRERGKEAGTDAGCAAHFKEHALSP